jgi:hypothetical protein
MIILVGPFCGVEDNTGFRQHIAESKLSFFILGYRMGNIEFVQKEPGMVKIWQSSAI